MRPILQNTGNGKAGGNYPEMGHHREVGIYITRIFMVCGLFLMILPSYSLATTSSRIICSVTGADMFQPAITPNMVCKHFQQALVAALGQDYIDKKLGDPPAFSLLAVKISISKRGILTAVITEDRQGKAVTHPPVSVAVSDRAPSLTSLELLALSAAAEMRYVPK